MADMIGNTINLDHVGRQWVAANLERMAREFFNDPVIEVQHLDPGKFVIVIRAQPHGTLRFRVQVVQEQ